MLRAVVNRWVGRRRRWSLALPLCLLGIGSDSTSGQQRDNGPPPVTLEDPRLEQLRLAAARWEDQTGPTRSVVDQVCLVPDLATFCVAIGQWDRTRYYPILIEDAESTLRFLRSFRPARVIRYPRAVGPIPPGKIWASALAAVAESWREPGQPVRGGSAAITLDQAPAHRDVRPPGSLGPTPPGVVLSSPDAPMLPGAIALAAGRFQPLARFDSAHDDRQTLTLDEFRLWDRDLSTRVAEVAPEYLRLGDDCDFLTLAGSYPYRYRDAKAEVEAVDDGIGRTATGARWAYAGRLLGDPAASVYRAMCSLFLQPESVTWFNGYEEREYPWSFYSTRGASLRLSGILPTAARHAGDRAATVADWHDLFDPANRSGLVWINSHGSPTVFHLQGDEPASTSDVPLSAPCAVVMIHSFSAADPTDPATIAGRWLANGAFVYFGSINEPFLQAFRTPQLAADLIAEHLPLAAVLRASSIEPFGTPWRLEYLGDPLFQIKPPQPGVVGKPIQRLPPDQLADGCVIVAAPDLEHTPAASSPDQLAGAALRAVFDSAEVLASSPTTQPTDPTIAATIARLAELNPDQLTPIERRTHDAILADLLFFARRRAELRLRIEAIPPGERTPALVRYLDAIRGIDFAWLLAGDDFDRICATWTRLVHSDAPGDFRRQATTRIGALARDASRRADWSRTLRAAISASHSKADQDFLIEELRRVAAADHPEGRVAPPPR